MKTIEETYCIINKQTGRDLGLLVMRSALDGRGSIGTDIQILPLGDHPMQAGDYRLDFVKKMMVDETTNRRFAPVLIQGGAA